MTFRHWLEGYEDHRSKVMQAAFGRQFPFRDWFPPGQSRTYVQFGGGSDPTGQADEEVVDFIDEFKGDGKVFPLSPTGYRIVNYAAGHVSPKNSNRIYRIAKILVVARQMKEKELEAQLASGGISPMKHQRETKFWTDLFNDVTNAFQNSPHRISKSQSGTGGNKYQIVFSYDPHDIAKMSTDRNWTSCMNLDGGENRKHVYCEVARGGFVAYLIDPADVEITRPKARIHIRRFSNKQGGNIALPEETAYGDDVPGFLDAVKKWIEQKQGRIAKGFYKMRGGQYSDTFSKLQAMVPSHEKGLLKWIEAPRNAGPAAKDTDKWKRSLPYAAAALVEFFKHEPEHWSPGFAEKVFNAIKDDPYTFGEQIRQMTIKYPQFADLADTSKYSGWDLEKMLKKVQDPQQRQAALDSVRREVEEGLAAPIKSIEGRSMYGVMGHYQDLLRKLQVFNPIPEPLIQKVIAFVYKLDRESSISSQDKAAIPDGWDRPEKNLMHAAISLFSLTNSDTPSVIRFYENYIKQFGLLDRRDSTIIWALAKLGRNGVRFVPQLKEAIMKANQTNILGMSNWDKESLQHVIENLKYAIDSIETGSLSQRYEFSH